MRVSLALLLPATGHSLHICVAAYIKSQPLQHGVKHRRKQPSLNCALSRWRSITAQPTSNTKGDRAEYTAGTYRV